MQKISLFQCLDKSSKPINEISVDDALQIIKNHPNKEEIEIAKSDKELGGKNNPIMKFNDRVWDYKSRKLVYTKRNYYDHMKKHVAHVVTWNCFVSERRIKDKIQAPSGYIYCDVDDYTKIIKSGKAVDNYTAKEYVKKTLKSNSLKFVKAVWESFSGEGLGFLVKVNGITIENFKSTWKALEKMFFEWGIVIDPQTKDITRCNVLPYDPNLFIREESSIIGFDAVEDKIEEKVVISIPIPDELRNDILAFELESLYKKTSSWSNNHISYKFFFDYFIFCNKNGIELETGLQFLIANESRYPKLFGHRDVDTVRSEIIDNINYYYSHQFGERHINSDNEFTVENVYIKYSGDIKLKMEYHWDILSEKLMDKDAKIRSFSKTLKESGVPKKDVELFFENFWGFDESVSSIINKVYGDNNILFGVKKNITEEGKRKKIKEYYEWAEKNGYRIIESENFNGNVEKLAQKFLTEAKNIFKGLCHSNVYKYIGYIFKNSKASAVKLEDITSEVMNIVLDNEETNDIVFSSDMSYHELNSFKNKLPKIVKLVSEEVYSYEPWKFGLRHLKTVTPENIRSRYKISKEYFLKPGQYINQIDIPNNDNQVIWGNTGQGKTTWICNHIQGKRLILVPIIPLLLSIEDYNASVYYKDKKNVQEGDELIVCTYSSFPNLLQQMKRWENTKISDYALFVDEEHNFAVSSSPDFRGYDLNFIVDNMHLFKSRKFLTGTKFMTLHPKLKDFEIIRVNWEKTPIKKCTPVRYNNLIYAIEKKLSKDGKNLIYLQNKKEEGQLGSLIDYLELKGWDKDKIWTINADEKGSDNFNVLTKEHKVSDDVQIIICTSVIVEGVNINNLDFKSVHFMTPESAINMEQMVNRLREVFTKSEENNGNIYIYKNIKTVDDINSDHVDIIELQEKYISFAKQSLEMVGRSYTSGDSISYKNGIKQYNNQLFGKQAYYRNNNGVLEVDYLSIANMAYKEEKAYAQKNIEFLKVLLHEYNWHFNPEEYILEDLDVEDAEQLKLNKEERKALLVKDVLKILDEIREEGETECCNKIEDENVSELEGLLRASYQVSLRVKIKYLCNNMNFKDACNLVEDWINIHNMSDRIWTKMSRQITVKLSKMINTFKNMSDHSSEFAKQLFKTYKKAKKYEKEVNESYKFRISDIEKFVNKAKKAVREPLVSSSEAVEIFKSYFDCNEYLDGNGIYYSIIGIKIINELGTFNSRLEKWAENCYLNETLLSSDELALKLNYFRSDLPILNMYRLNTKDAMRLIHDYYTFERVSSKKVKNKKINLYKFTALEPEEISKYEFNPLRKIDPSNKHQDDMTQEELNEYQMGEYFENLNYYLSISKEPEMNI